LKDLVERLAPRQCCPRHQAAHRHLRNAVQHLAQPCLLCGRPGAWRQRWPAYRPEPCGGTVETVVYYDLCAVCRQQPATQRDQAVTAALTLRVAGCRN
jgi:hypothetical protein